MSISLTTTQAMVDENGELRGLEPLQSLRGRKVQVVVFVDERAAEYNDAELTPAQWNRMAMQSSAFADWADPAEDIYTLEDGEPIKWEVP